MSDLTTWLNERTALNLLNDSILEQIEPLLIEKNYPSETILIQEGTDPDGLYILKR